jgi:BirA family transcriptional regulator, biotin operon repressor / biotin---[acetyl-CoA-carboxylase] ligase
MTPRFSSLERPGLNPKSLRDGLCAPAGAFARVDVVGTTGSTNADLARLALEAPESWPDLSVLTTEVQTAGRGRLDRPWTAPERSSIFVSVLLRPLNRSGGPLPPQSYSWLSLISALALVEAVADRAEVQADIKWPNDVQVDGRKLAGILAQLVTGGTEAPAVVVGTGLNVSLSEDELPVPTATSLALSDAATTDRNVLLKAYLRTFAELYRRFCTVDGDARAAWTDGSTLSGRIAERMVTLGQQVRAQLPGGGVLEGLATGLDADGALLLTDASGGHHTVSAGDVVHLRPA